MPDMRRRYAPFLRRGFPAVPRLTHTSFVVAPVAYLLLLGAILGTGQWRIAAFLVVPILCLVVYTHPVFGIGVNLAIFFLGDRLVGLGYLPKEILWVSDLIMLTLLLRVVARSRDRSVDWGGPVIWGVVGLALLSVVSIAVNAMGFSAAVVGFRFMFRFLLYYFVIINLELSRTTLKRIVSALFAIALVQIPVSLFQYLGAGSIVDTNSGTLQVSGGEEMAFVCTVTAEVLLCVYFSGRRTLWMLVPAVGLLLPCLVTGARGASVVFFPLAFVLAIVLGLAYRSRSSLSRTGQSVIVLGLAALLLTGSGFYATLLAPNIFSNVQEVVAAESITGSEFGRLSSLQNSVALVKQEPWGQIVGLGPGVTGESDFAFGQARAMVPVTGAFRTQIATSIVELGYLGLVLVVGIPLLTILGLPPIRSYHDRFWRALRIGAVVALLLYLVYYSYYMIWMGGASSVFLWILVAAVRAAGREEVMETPRGRFS
jgi:hypothetical protein